MKSKVVRQGPFKYKSTSFEERSFEIQGSKYTKLSLERLKLATKRIAADKDNIECAISGSILRRIAADRDIIPEPSSIEGLGVEQNGEGATNVIQQFINNSGDEFPESLIGQTLLYALGKIFGTNGSFKFIKVKKHGEANDSTKWEIYLDEDNKPQVPLGKSGSGLKTIILVLLNLHVVPHLEQKLENISDYVFAFEELENNLHPALLRRLLEYLSEYVKEHKCHLFLTTHSNVVLDYFSQDEDAQILQVTHDGKSASVATVQTHFDKLNILDDLGCKPSDLLQANGIIWLEGPSDRIYINKLIELYSGGKLKEGRHYQCVQYGGSNLANIQFNAPEGEDSELANLLCLNKNIAVLCDSDVTSDDSKLKDRVDRIVKEVSEIPSAFLWVSKPKEIENYIPAAVWNKIYGNETDEISDPLETDRFPSSPKSGDYIFNKFNRKSFDKRNIAKKAIQHFTTEMFDDRFDMKEKMNELVEAIRGWNK